MSRNVLSASPARIAEMPTKYDIANIGGEVNWNLLRGDSDYAQLTQVSYDNQAADYVLLQTKREVYVSTVEAYQIVVP